MKEMFKLAFVYAGCYLGAGYVSGQEIWQFFGTFGKYGFSGLSVALLLQFALGCMVVLIAKEKGIYEADEIIVKENNKFLRGLFGFFESFFMFGIFVIMSAGAGALLNKLFSVNESVAMLLFCALCGVCALKGVKGMEKAFSFVVPLLVAFTLVISALCIRGKGVVVSVCESFENPLLSNWLVSAGVFVSYNFFCSVAILAPVGVSVRNKKNSLLGILLGCVFLFVIASGILVSINAFPDNIYQELPMLSLSFSINRVLGVVFGILLLLAMFSTSLSCLVATDVYLKSKLKKMNGFGGILIMCIGGFLLGGLGFSKLISFVYPLCGYLGFFAAAGIIINFFKRRKQ